MSHRNIIFKGDNMETSPTTSEKRRRKRKKKSMNLNYWKENPYKSSQRINIKKFLSQNISIGKVKKKAEQYLDPSVQGFCEHLISFPENQEKGFAECNQRDENPFEQTVDLCNDNSSVDSSCSSVVMVEPKNETLIDLSIDVREQNEVIDLTNPISMPQSESSGENNLVSTVINISEDESEGKEQNYEPENDEICVVGIYKKSLGFHNKSNNNTISFVPLSNRWNNFSNLITCSEKLKKKYIKKHSLFDKFGNRNVNQFRRQHRSKKRSCLSKVAQVGENIYVNSPVSLPSSGLRPIIIDGSNVAFVHSDSNFSCKRLEICINYFKEKGHKVTAFVPQFRINSHKSDNPLLLRKLEKQGDVILTPSKKIDGKNIVPYDDRFIVQTAVLKGGIIVSRDNYNDLLKENPAWAETIKYRTLAFTWVDDVLMFPKDPLGEFGPSLEEFLRFH